MSNPLIIRVNMDDGTTFIKEEPRQHEGLTLVILGNSNTPNIFEDMRAVDAVITLLGGAPCDGALFLDAGGNVVFESPARAR